MMYLRWYDKDPTLKEFLTLLQSFDPQTIDILAQDFIQIIMDSGYLSADTTLDLIKKNTPYQYNRWYDKNYNLHTCVELLKLSDSSQREKLINSFKEALFQLVTQIYYEQEQ